VLLRLENGITYGRWGFIKMSDDIRFTVAVPEELYSEFRVLACSKSFNRGWFKEAITEAMTDYIKKYNGE